MKPNQLGALAWAAILSVILLAPALQVALGGRDVDALDFTIDVAPDSLIAWIGRASVAVVLTCAALALLGSVDGLKQPSRYRRAAAALRWSIIGFILGHTVLPSLLGVEYPQGVGIFYGSVLLLVAYRAGRLTSTASLAAVKWGLVILMAIGLVTIVVAPHLSVQVASAPVRLPFIDFRYWGVGSNPNNLAPLALCLILLMIYQPFRLLAVNVLAGMLAVITLLLTQSQTTWMASLMVLPFFALYRVLPKPVRKARIDPYLLVGTIVLTAAGLLMLVWELAQVDYSVLTDTASKLTAGAAGSVGSDDASDSLLNRVEIWQVALDTWREHFWFGYGPRVWGTSFRLQVGMPYAFNAHNQLMQSISTGGLVGLAALVIYLLTLFSLCVRTAAQSHGLTMALFAMIIIRGFTEAPLDTHTLLSGELFMHLLLVYLLAVFLWRDSALPGAARSKRRRRRRRSVFAPA